MLKAVTPAQAKQVLEAAIPDELLYRHFGIYLDWLATENPKDEALYQLVLEFKAMRRFGYTDGWTTKKHFVEAWGRLNSTKPSQELFDYVYDLEMDLRCLLADLLLAPAGPKLPDAISFGHVAGYGIRIADGLPLKDVLRWVT